MNASPQVTVIIPTYNRAGLIGQAIDSVLAQTYPDFELIVVDDGSTDATLEILAAYGDRIKAIRQSNKGYGGSYARNAGIQVAKGKWIGFLDSDDYWRPSKLEAQVAVFEANPNLKWVYSDCDFVGEHAGELLYRQSVQHKLPEGDVLISLFIKNFIPSITPLIHSDVFDAVGMFWPSPKATDWDMWLRIAERYPLAFVPDSLASMRVHEGRLTSQIASDQSMAATLRVVERAVARNPERLKPIKNQAIANLYIAAGMLVASQGRLSEARQLYRTAIRSTPRRLRPWALWSSTFVGQSGMRAAIRFRRAVRAIRSQTKREQLNRPIP